MTLKGKQRTKVSIAKETTKTTTLSLDPPALPLQAKNNNN